MDRLPSLSLRRTTSSRLRLPSGSTRGTRKQVRPPAACASTRNTSFIGADVNHLWPCRVYSPSTDGRRRLGQVGPDVGAALLLGHAHAGQRAGLLRRPAAARGRRTSTASRGVHSLAIASSARSAGTAAYVIEIGQPWPGSVCDQAKKPAARRTCACGPSEVHGRRLQPVADAALHQPVPGRVEAHLVDPVAVAVVRRQLGLVPVGQHPVLAGLGRAGHRADRREVVDHLRTTRAG